MCWALNSGARLSQGVTGERSHRPLLLGSSEMEGWEPSSAQGNGERE